MDVIQMTVAEQNIQNFRSRAFSLSKAGRVCRQLALSLILTLAVIAPVAAQESGALEEIIVTAQKREQSLQEVPASVAVYSAELMEKMNAKDFADFADSVPGMTFAATGVGNSRYFIRGIGQVSAGLSPTTGIYIDETPIQTHGGHASSQPDPILFDLARMEVLRGPQGVLFGSSAMGGTVRVVTNQPDASKFESMVDAGISGIKDGDQSWDMRAMINVPLVKDTLALRVVGTRGFDGGWIDDLRPVTADLSENINNPSAIVEDVNSVNYEMVRATLSYTPNETLTIKPSVMYQKQEQDVDRVSNELTFGIEGRLRARYQDNFANDEFLIGNLIIEKELDTFGGVSLLSSSSYLEKDFEVAFGGAAFLSSEVEAIVGPTPNGELYWASFNTTLHTEQFTQEIRAVSTSDSRWQYVVGVYFNTIEQSQRGFNPVNNLFGATAPSPFGASNPPLLLESFSVFEEDEIAVFADLSFSLSDYLTLSIGGRFFDYEQTDTRRAFGLGGEIGGDLKFQFSEKNAEDGFTPRVVLSYQPNDAINVYGSFSTGFRTGGINEPIPDSTCTPAERTAAGLPDVPPPFQSDSTENLELGAKTRWLDGRITLNASVYSIDWDDFQQTVFTTCGAANQFLVDFTTNAGAVESDGAELEFSISFTDDFLVFGGVSYTDAIFKEEFTNLGLPAGSSLLDVPEITWNIRGEYSFPVGGNWDGNVMLAANYVDDSITGFGEGSPEPRPNYTVVDFMTTFASDTLSVSLSVDNIFDETQVYGQEFSTNPFSTTATTFFAALTGQPRTIGVRVRKRFE